MRRRLKPMIRGLVLMIVMLGGTGLALTIDDLLAEHYLTAPHHADARAGSSTNSF
jgi:hypothetical protein